VRTIIPEEDFGNLIPLLHTGIASFALFAPFSKEFVVKKLSALIISAALGTSLLSGCTTDGGAKPAPTPSAIQPSTQSGSSMSSQDLSSSITISGAIGSEPQFGATHGNPPTALSFQDIKIGDGAAAVPTSTLTVHYKLLTWSDGKIADSSWTSGNPATFPLANVVKGWQEGLPGMKVGGRRLLIVPPALGYGSQDYGPIKGNETLVFVVDLLGVK
jgi:peptidylprolyl isomerase